MSLQFTSSPSSRIRKTKVKPRLTSSPGRLSQFRQRTSVQEKSRNADEEVENFSDQLPDIGILAPLVPRSSIQDVVQAIRHIQRSMFSEMPERASGMNSTRISAVLNHRASLPPLVSLSHVHAILNTPTTTEREIARLIRDGTLRRISIPGRSDGRSGITEMLVLMEDWQQMVSKASDLTADVKAKYMNLLRANSDSLEHSMWRSMFSEEESRLLMHAGFLVATNQAVARAAALSGPSMISSGTLSSVSACGSQAASGSLRAIGGESVIHDAGGGSGSLGRASTSVAQSQTFDKTSAKARERLSFALPSTGSYLRLANSARAHFMSLVSKSKFKEAPLDLLEHRWDGGVAGEDPISHAKKARGEFNGVLPGRTRKWKDYYGLTFQWMLGECVAAGLVELFETGTVGRGIRAR